MSTQEIVGQEQGEAAIRPLRLMQLERLDRTISGAERHAEAQQRLIVEAALAGRTTAHASFELQKMQLLIAILREGRARLLERQARGGERPSQRARTARGWIGPDRTTPLNSPATVSGATAGRHRRCCHTRRGW